MTGHDRGGSVSIPSFDCAEPPSIEVISVASSAADTVPPLDAAAGGSPAAVSSSSSSGKVRALAARLVDDGDAGERIAPTATPALVNSSIAGAS